MLGFGDKVPAAPQGGTGIPTQRVLSLSSQGMSEPEIIRTLQSEGYQPMAVDRAMKDAMRSGAGQPPRPPGMMPPPHAPMAPPASRMAPQPAYPQGASYGHPVPPAPMAPSGMNQPFGGFEQPSFSKNKYAPTDWGEDDDLPDDDLDMQDVPKERRLGPAALFSDLDDEKIPIPGVPERAPLRFMEAPLPKERDERDRELKDRRRHEVEEMVEQIAEEKWQDMARRVHDVDERVENLSSEVRNSPVRAAGGPAPEDVLALKNDISSIKQSIEETNARIDSLEEVVKGSLSPMIESIRKLRGAAPSDRPERVERPERYQQSPQPQARPQRPPAPSAMDESYEIPRYAPKRDESG